MKQGLIGLLTGAAITTAGFLGNNYMQTHEYQRTVEINKKAVYIVNNLHKRVYEKKGGAEHDYEIDGKEVTVSLSQKKDPKCDERLKIKVSKDLILYSDNWTVFPSGDAGILDLIQVRLEKPEGWRAWKTYSRNKIEDYDALQKIYEELIEQIADKRLKIEDDRLKSANQRAHRDLSQLLNPETKE